MATRRQEKVASVVKEVVSETITHHLNDPRIEGFVSVTRVEMAADLRSAEVYLSIMGKTEAAQNKTFTAISHARSRIQFFVGRKLQSKFSPVLRFHKDERFKKTLETMRLIDQAAAEYSARDGGHNGQEQAPDPDERTVSNAGDQST